MDKKTKIILSIGTIAGLGAAVWLSLRWFKKQAGLLADYCFNVIGHKFTSLGLDSSSVDIYTEVKNKSNLDVMVKDYSLDIYANNVFISKAVSKTPQNLPKNSKSPITISFQFSVKQVLKDTWKSLVSKANLNTIQDYLSNKEGYFIDKSKVIITIKGTVSIANKNLISLYNLPVSISMPLSEMVTGNSTEC